MAKEKFLIIAVRQEDDCFGRFSESANRDALDAGTSDTSDPYSWIEASYNLVLVRDKEATHLCSFTPNAWQVFIQNAFVGKPNEAWEDDGDPEGLEQENGGERGSYGTYRDEYDSAFVCDTFTIDTMKDLDKPLRKPRDTRLSDRGDKHEAYHDAIWKAAEEAAHEISHNGLWCDALDVMAYRQRERANNPVIQHLTA
jgi:hypothetical protein